MARRVLIRAKEYHDSVRLMRVSEAVRREPGVSEAMVMMATPNNKKILATSGLGDDVANAASDDLVIAVVADSEESAESALKAAETALTEKARSASQGISPRTLDAAVAGKPNANLAVISVPGQFAFQEAKRALTLGLNVLMFSDNVPLDQERELKDLAAEKDRLMMGPDCGTALINGVGLGFANKVATGRIGIVGASGTGIQEISCLIDAMGQGVSHAIGTGGRDLSEEIGGSTMLQGLKMLAADPGTDVIVIASKPPSPAVADKVLEGAARLSKPVVVNFLGKQARGGYSPRGDLRFAGSLADAAATAVRLIDPSAKLPALDERERQHFLFGSKSALKSSQVYLRGLYAGGTLSYEAMLILSEKLGPVHSNLAKGELAITDLFTSKGHTVIDMGDDAYTQGRAHPMIDPTLRNQRILKEAEDPEVALLLMDLVIGYGAHPDPAGDLEQAIAQAREIAAKDGRALPVIVTVCGTPGDPQNLSAQIDRLNAAGIRTTRSNVEAAKLAAELLGGLHAEAV